MGVGESVNPKHSLWLMPDEAESDRIRPTIERLAREHGGPRIDPHLTLLGGIRGRPESLLAGTIRLAAGTAPFDLTLRGVGFRDDLYRSLFLRAEPSAAFAAMRARAQQIFQRHPDEEAVPHVSLAYVRLALNVKERIRVTLGSSLDLVTGIRIVRLMATEGPPASWRMVIEAPLSGVG